VHPSSVFLNDTLRLLLRSLERENQIAISLYSLVREPKSGEMFFDPVLSYHRSPLCLKVKKDKAQHRRCMEYKSAKLERAFEGKEIFFDLCPFGVVDQVIPFPQDNPLFVLFVSDARRLYGRRRATQNLMTVDPKLLGVSPTYLDSIDSVRLILESFLSSQNQKWIAPFSGSPLGKKVALAKHAITYRYQSDLTLTSVAKELSLSPTMLARVYKKAIGKTFHQDLNSQRVMRSQELLFCGTSVTEAAHEVGYCDAGYFHRVFKKQCGMGPKEWLRSKKFEKKIWKPT
jgi:AraC-like DNA-binding protein